MQMQQPFKVLRGGGGEGKNCFRCQLLKDDLSCGSCTHFPACPPHSLIVSTEGIQLLIIEKAMAQ